MSLQEEIREIMKSIREGVLPSSEVIVSTAFEELGYDDQPPPAPEIRKEFNDRLAEVFKHTLEVLERFEDRAYAAGIPDALLEKRPDSFRKAAEMVERSGSAALGIRKAFRALLIELYPVLRQIFLSISQSRKARGGRDFELQIGRMLDYANVPYQKIARQTRTDFMVPNDKRFTENRNAALVLSAKRTLRERWREVTEELFNLRSPNVYLLTADYDVTSGHVSQICDHYNIHLVVWDETKISKFPSNHLVLGYSRLMNEVVPTFEQRW